MVSVNVLKFKRLDNQQPRAVWVKVHRLSSWGGVHEGVDYFELETVDILNK